LPRTRSTQSRSLHGSSNGPDRFESRSSRRPRRACGRLLAATTAHRRRLGASAGRTAGERYRVVVIAPSITKWRQLPLPRPAIYQSISTIQHSRSATPEVRPEAGSNNLHSSHARSFTNRSWRGSPRRRMDQRQRPRASTSHR
jgi:hypothetical protein